MVKADVWMPLFIGDYLADTTRLTTEQHGAYMLLIMDYWRNGPPPDDAATLAQITRLSPDAWSIAQAKLKDMFSIENGVWRHKRIDEELIAAKENKGRAQAKAKAAADARWKNTPSHASGNATSNAPSMPQAMLDECPSPSPSPTPLTKQKPRSKSKDKPPSATFDPTSDLSKEGVLDQTAADWLAMRKAKRAPVTATVLRNIILEVGKAGMSMDAALALACSRGWVGFQAEWVLRDQRAGPAVPYQTANDKARAWGDELTGRTTNHEHGRTITDINEPPVGFLDFRDFAQDAP